MTYRTMTGRPIATDGLGPGALAALAELTARHGQNPSWDEFAMWARSRLRGLVPPRDVTHPLYLIAQDLEMRLGVAQGKVAKPDYRDYIADRIAERFVTRTAFCAASGVEPRTLALALHGGREGVDAARAVAAKLGLDFSGLPGLPGTDDRGS